MIKRILSTVAVTFALSFVCKGAGETDFTTLRALADKGEPYITDVLTNFVFAEDVTQIRITELKDNMFLEGYIVGCPLQFPRNENLEIAWQAGSMSASPNNNARTVYLESPDGKYGLRLFFETGTDALAAGPLFSYLKLNLKGARLVKEYNYYVITGLKAGNVLSYGARTEADLPVKKKHIAELTDDDIFTWVALQDCEFVFKCGAYMNCRETYLPKSRTGRYTGNGWMNGWARLVYDNEGSSIYLGLDAKLDKRREGDGVPTGTGEVSGVLTKAYMPRYGKVREYFLRPPSLYEVRFSREDNTPWNTIALWDWNMTSQGIIPAEYGKGFLMTDCPAEIGRNYDCDNPANEKPGENPISRGTYGVVDNGAMSFSGKASDWWDWTTGNPRSLTVIFPTLGMKGTSLIFAWTFSAGKFNQETSHSYPSHWQVSYSTDGVNFTTVPDFRADLHSLPYSGGQVEGMHYETSAEAGIGYTEHIVNLPASLLGQKKVMVRLSPADKTIANMAYLHRDVMEATAGSDQPCLVNFGEIQIRYK